ncbi:copper chaperone PCu(A)C [Pseudaestuariivita rosea]|uniref:copper chaperone PCu(A)C n=1 Tax=Pseudaestuariivita rosea TaxID=2763263 RepID=UPI001ABA7727|nr:copper chaperone PCu(A)C [Pseudaestuariivita rosea]
MFLTRFCTAAAVSLALAIPAVAEIKIMDPYARASTPMAKSGAAFLGIMNMGEEDDRLISARSNAAVLVELHTHIEEDGIMQMVEVKEGFSIAAGETHMLERGGDHVMFMGLNRPFNQGDMIDVTLIFEKAGEVQVQIPVDLERQPQHGAHGHGAHSDHGHDHGMKHGDGM